MSNCSSGCLTQDHATYGECLKAKNSSVAGMQPSQEYKRRDLWQTEIKEYRAARAQGIQPKSTKLADIRSAVSASQKLDKAVQQA